MTSSMPLAPPSAASALSQNPDSAPPLWPNRRPVILVAGALTGPERLYLPLLESLGSSVYPILQPWAVDRPGIRPQDYQLRDELRLVEESASRAGRHRVDIVAFSGGCTGALQFSITHPERVRTLTLIEPAWLGNTPWHPAETEFLRSLDRAVKMPAHRAVDAFCAALVDRRVTFERSTGLMTGAKHRAVQGLCHAWNNWRSEDFDLNGLSRISSPVYLPVGSDSTSRMRVCAEFISKRVPHARVEVLPGSHHLNILHTKATLLAASLTALWKCEADSLSTA